MTSFFKLQLSVTCLIIGLKNSHSLFVKVCCVYLTIQFCFVWPIGGNINRVPLLFIVCFLFAQVLKSLQIHFEVAKSWYKIFMLEKLLSRLLHFKLQYLLFITFFSFVFWPDRLTHLFMRVRATGIKVFYRNGLHCNKLKKSSMYIVTISVF